MKEAPSGLHKMPEGAVRVGDRPLDHGPADIRRVRHDIGGKVVFRDWARLRCFVQTDDRYSQVVRLCEGRLHGLGISGGHNAVGL